MPAGRGRRAAQLEDGRAGSGVFREVHVTFAADVISSVMVRIQRRQVAAATGLADAEAYEQLAELLLSGLRKA
ncbi:TetR/AcrR family transcriptional regulator [Streptomyces tanashiensis]